MTGKEQLLELLRDQAAQKIQTEGIDWATKQDEWLESLRKLMAQMKAWLSDAKSDGLLSIEDVTCDLSEDHLGTYSAPGLVITAPSGRKVDVAPHALVVIGAQGRVDLLSGPNRAMLIRSSDTGEWLLATREAGAISTQPLTDETFSEILWAILS